MYNTYGERILWTIGILKASPEEMTARHGLTFVELDGAGRDFEEQYWCSFPNDAIVLRMYVNSPFRGTEVLVAVELNRKEGLLLLEETIGFEEFYWITPLDSEAHPWYSGDTAT